MLEQVAIDESTDAARRERFPRGAAIEFADLEEAGREAALRRSNARRHLAFSFGEHFCLGAHLARIEIRAALERLIDLPMLRLVAVEEPEGFAFRRPPTLRLAWETYAQS